MYHVYDVLSAEGDAHALVHGLNKVFDVQGLNVKDGDRVTFQCEGAAIAFTVRDGSFEAALTFEFAMACPVATVQYAFGAMTADFSSLVYTVKVVSAVEDKYLLEGSSVEVGVEGRSVALGDKVKLVKESCEEEAAVFDVLEAAEKLSFVALLESVEAASYKVCYQFQSEPRFALTTFSLNAFAVAVSHFENDAIVVADVNTVVASGYGLSAEDRLLVSMTEACSADWSFVPTVEEVTRLTFAVSIPASYARLHLCYKFSTGDVVSLHYAFRASTIKSSNLERVVNRVLTTASFEGPMAGDRIAIVASGEACDSTEYQFTLSEMLRISGVITFPGLIPAYADVCYAVNSKWVRMFTVPVLGLSNIVPESVVANYEYSFFVNATHITGECEASKLPFAESWVNYGCDFTNNLYTGRVENIFDDSEDAPAVRLGGMGSNACSSRLGPNGNYIVLDLGSCFDVTKITIATEDSSSDVNTWRVLAAADSNMLFSEVLFSDNDNHVSVGLNEKELEFSGRLMKLEFLTNRGHPLYTTIRKIALYGHACAASPDFALKYVAPSAACAAPGEEIPVSTCSQRFIKAFDVSFDEKKVCFKHPAYPQFVEYPDITMQLKYISGLAGSNKLAVGGSRFAQLVGKGVETGDELKFVHQGMTCEDAMPVLTVMGTSTVLLQGFTEVGTYTLCYKFGELDRLVHGVPRGDAGGGGPLDLPRGADVRVREPAGGAVVLRQGHQRGGRVQDHPDEPELQRGVGVPAARGER